MKYLCLAYGDRTKMDALSKEALVRLVKDCKPHDDELNKYDGLIIHEGLSWDVTTIRPRNNGKPSVTDGPFVETKEQVGGFFVIEARDLAEAVRVASKHPAAHMGEHLGWAIEVRPIEVFDPGKAG
jgi:hypothetical protein